MVLASGSGTNLQALVDDPVVGPCIALVVSDRPDARALARARDAGIEAVFLDPAPHPDRASYGRALLDVFGKADVKFVALAGFMRILAGEVVQAFEGRMLNVHPSLLPAFPGVGAIERSVEHGVRVTGVTVHFVDEHLDNGPILFQQALELSYPADIEEIEQRVHALEHQLLPRAVRLIASGRVRIDPGNPRVVLVDDVD